MRMVKSKEQKAIVKTDAAFYAQVRDVFVLARQFVHKTANFAMVKAYWLVVRSGAAVCAQVLLGISKCSHAV